MGADLNIELFTEYFTGMEVCPVVDVKGRMFPIRTLFLEDLLRILEKNPVKAMKGKKSTPLSVQQNADALIEQVWTQGDVIAFQAFTKLVKENQLSVDYPHTETNGTFIFIGVVFMFYGCFFSFKLGTSFLLEILFSLHFSCLCID